MLLRIIDQPSLDLASDVWVEWFDPASESVGEGSPAEAAIACRGRSVTVLAPARDIVLHQAQLPARNRQQLVKAAPYALEERFACDPEQLHFAFPSRLQKGRVEVAAVSRACMGQWLGALAEAGIKPKRVLPESLALSVEEGEWGLLLDSSQAILRNGRFSASALPRGEAHSLLTMALAESDSAPKRLRIHAPEGDGILPELQEWCRAEGVEAIVDHPRCPLAVLAAGLDPSASVNLLQGDYSPVSSHQGVTLRAWRRVAILVGLLILIKGGMTAQTLHELRQQDSMLSGEIEQIYRDTFPDTRNLVDPRFQMEQRLAELSGTSGKGELPRLLAAIAPHLRGAQGVFVRELSYQPGGLELELELPDFNGLDRLTALLGGEAGLSAEVISANAQRDSVRGRLRVAGGGA
jgi:general secretion pathway protein L